MVYLKTIAGLKEYSMDSDELRQMSIDNAKLALDQAKRIKEMETKDELDEMLLSIDRDWGKYLAASGSATYKSLLDEIEKLAIANEIESMTPNENSIMKLTEDKRKGIETLLAWIEPLRDYRIGSREIGGDVIIDQLKKVLLIEGYDKVDKELLNHLRVLYGKRIEA
jgi:hypothetical protein